jgi:hypothetical protein
MNVHNCPEPYDGSEQMEISDDEADEMLGNGKRSVETLGFHLAKELLPLFGERTAAGHIDMTIFALEPGLACILWSRRGMNGEKGEHTEKTNEHNIFE